MISSNEGQSSQAQQVNSGLAVTTVTSTSPNSSYHSITKGEENTEERTEVGVPPSSTPEPIDNVSESFATLSVNPASELSESNTIDKSNTNEVEHTKNASQSVKIEEDLSPEEASLRAKGLKSTHRPGFYVHINSPRRLRIQTKSKTFDLDRYCPHANADLLKWGVLRADMTLRCGVHYWGFDLVKNGQCIAHPDETLNACPVSDLEW
ncbi:hypothetical protein BX616_000557 [Lobosporangium transversale]|uniref:Rieske domain-containing protein n=1 Tax=Lobosporangium transversale TaxID=64571 RepID=A0A1Y2GAJ8_9FUNG|nr:hypothetical protein BCR41DRAFT_390596 [Lobosporangium transversale]KAF9906976.1 hypothetical protein BX616_000557 [Lobosporangium transversale]ORY98296.1 hypothetical protein BCR41DRAFT_390596 [Lobosporangium transversale]|eukprot:XP_021875725.1 hypothetical protein BCR41DRAFT_390596 [Lobosporangium transversale]